MIQNDLRGGAARINFFRLPMPAILYDEIEKVFGRELTAFMYVRISYLGV